MCFQYKTESGTKIAMQRRLATMPDDSLYFYLKEKLTMKKLATAVIIAFLGSITLPVLAADKPADKPKTPEECKKLFTGDDAKIKACLDDLKK